MYQLIAEAAEHYSTAMLEILANGSGRLPDNQHFIQITIPNGVSYELLNPAHLSGWDASRTTISQACGEA